jgi:hypothetical protein
MKPLQWNRFARPCKPVLMPPPNLALSMPRAGEMPGSAVRDSAPTRFRERTGDTFPRPRYCALHSHRDPEYCHTQGTSMTLHAAR